jgi:farnesyl-diphosphate farnesyltransferase
MDLMHADACITVDFQDNMVGHMSKYDAHIFSKDTPRGTLHRAFSVFLFDKATNTLLLQQRAHHKITFPNVWTNTCCSHPLYGMEPSEVDYPDAVASGKPIGVARAAVRKLEQELGIPSDQLDAADFKFLTRLHYFAADTVTHGAESPWGEHEVDYVLFATVDRSKLTVKPNADEVDAVKWVTKEGLVEAMKNDLWSPWFRLIANKWLLSEGGWWDDLNLTMTTDIHCDYTSISRFDPPAEHLGGGGNAGPLLGDINKSTAAPSSVNDGADKKQGAYGKVKTHKESKLSQLVRLDEVMSAITLLYIKPLKSNLSHPSIAATHDEEALKFCDEILGKVSRSFAAVIRQLPPQLLVEVMVFYLVLRALDTVEDDMEAFENNETKIAHLLRFHETALGDPRWCMDRVGEADEKRLLQEFPKLHKVFAKLSGSTKSVIKDITMRMAGGMAEFVGKDLGQGTRDIKEYNRYCHFVAGLVGEGLSRLFACSGLEKKTLESQLFLSDQMGLFLQKTNIIRDYLEDYVDGRAFWPAEVWKKYSKSGDLGYFKFQEFAENRKQSLACLNELVADALELVPDCLAYLALLQCSEVFRFCAIPQVMAIATLDTVFNNPQVFTGVCKIRKGMSCKLLLNTNGKEQVQATFAGFARSITKQAQKSDPSYTRTLEACDKILEICEPTCLSEEQSNGLNRLVKFVRVGNTVAPVVLGVSGWMLNESWKSGKWGDSMLPRLSHTDDVVLLALVFCAVMYLLCFCGMTMVMGEEAVGVKKRTMRKSISAGSMLVSAEAILSSQQQ